jgi:hypothetical protein
MEKTYVNEKTGGVTVREYDINQPSNPPTRKQILFPDPIEEGCIAVDWTPEVENVLGLLGISINYSKCIVTKIK